MRKHPRLLLAIASLVLMTACVTPGQTGPMTSDASQIRDQLFKLQKDSAKILEHLEGIETQNSTEESSASSCAEALTRLTQLHQEVLVVEEQLLATQQRLDEALAQLRALRRMPARSWVDEAGAAPSTTPANPTPSSPGHEASSGGASTGLPTSTPGSSTLSGGDPEDLFNAAYADYSRGQFPLALAGFEGALRADPEGPLADDAQYWIGETLFASKRYLDAVAAFDQLIAGWPEGDKLPRAHLKKGIALFEARRTAEGVQTLQFVLSTWPDSDEARIAQEYFRRKGIVQD